MVLQEDLDNVAADWVVGDDEWRHARLLSQLLNEIVVRTGQDLVFRHVLEALLGTLDEAAEETPEFT